MKSYKIKKQGAKYVLQADGFRYAVYPSSPYHLYGEVCNGWRRINAPATFHKLWNTNIGKIFLAIQSYIKDPR